MSPRVGESIPSDPLAEVDEKTPVSMPFFEDLPTGRDALADHRQPATPAAIVTGRARPAAPAPSPSPAVAGPVEPEPAEAGLDVAPTTLLPQLRRGPLPGLVRESPPEPTAAPGPVVAPASAPVDFEADPAVPTAPARISEVERIAEQGRGSDPTVATPAPPTSAVEYEDQGDDVAAYDRAEGDGPEMAAAAESQTDEEGATPPAGTPTLMAVQAGSAEPAGSKLATVAMPQMTLPITPVTAADASVTMRQIIVVGPKPRRR